MSVFGPLTSFTALQKCGRYRTNSGQNAPSDLTGSAAFDPSLTWGSKAFALHTDHPNALNACRVTAILA
jgi:hypothetical protein